MPAFDDNAAIRLVCRTKNEVTETIREDPSLLSWRSPKDGYGLLHFAVEAKRPTVIELLVGLAADVNAKDVSGGTPLHLASLHAELRCIRMLLKLGADPNAPDNFDISPLATAASTGHETKGKVMQLLEEAGGQPDVLVGIQRRDETLFTRSLEAAVREHRRFVPCLVPSFARMWYSESLKVVGPGADSEEHLRSVREWSEPMLELAIKSGALINGPGTHGCPPAMIYLVENGSIGLEFLDLLLAQGADVNLKYQGRTVLKHAVQENVREWLVQHGAQ